MDVDLQELTQMHSKAYSVGMYKHLKVYVHVFICIVISVNFIFIIIYILYYIILKSRP